MAISKLSSSGISDGLKKYKSLNPIKATGGTITAKGKYVYHVFTGDSSFVPTFNFKADILVVAGGGAGGNGSRGAAGGAGGLQGFTDIQLTAGTSYTVTVGAGGSVGSYVDSATQSNDSTRGNNSVFGSLNPSIGGGRGGAADTAAGGRGGDGGSGGGSWYTLLGGIGSNTQGYNGGKGWDGGPNFGAGGGGGAGAVGAAGTSSVGGNGGNGSSAYSSWGEATGTGHNVSGTYWFAGGGSGDIYGGYGYAPGTPGNGGGGSGKNTSPSGQSGTGGTANTGGGGGSQGNGGSGIVIVRYLA
jgi:hypothetical protein